MCVCVCACTCVHPANHIGGFAAIKGGFAAM